MVDFSKPIKTLPVKQKFDPKSFNLNRKVFDKSKFNETVDRNFNQFIPQPLPSTFSSDLATIDDFFEIYNRLFYQIDKSGQSNSHEYLIKTSSEYTGYVFKDEEIQALLDEIVSLRKEILDLQSSQIPTS